MRGDEAGSVGMFSWGVVRRLLAIFVPAAALTGAVAVALNRHELSQEFAHYKQEGIHLGNLHADIINKDLETVESDLKYLANQEILKDYLSGRTRKDTVEQEYELFCRHRALYDQVRYLDKTGQERIRVNYANGRPVIVPENDLQLKANRYYFWGTMRLKKGDVFISPLDLNVEHDKIEEPLKPVIRFATPVFDKSNNKQGIVVLNYLGGDLIQKLKQVSIPFLPAKGLLLNSKGYFLRGPKPDDEWGFMLGHQRTFATYFPEEWERVRRGEWQFSTQQGLFTIQPVSPPSQRPAFGHGGDARSGPDGSDPDAGDPGLIVVWHIPPADLHRQSSLLLRRLIAFSGAFLLLVLALAWYLAYSGALRRRHEGQIADSEARLRTLSTQLITAQEDERRKISRDLHDEMGQLVTAVALDLQRASQAGDADKKNERIGRALHSTELLLTSIHEISARIRPTILDDLGLKDAVQNLLSDYERRTGIATQARLDFNHHDIEGVVAENVYRILQEALTNVSKHARAQEVSVDLRVTPRQVALAVRDEGLGFAPDSLNGKGLGLLGMRERAELLNGTFAVTSQTGKGTLIQVTIPLPLTLPSPLGGEGWARGLKREPT